jgi:hypothetical protein
MRTNTRLHPIRYGGHIGQPRFDLTSRPLLTQTRWRHPHPGRFEQVEVASLIGDIADKSEGKPALHIHIVVGTRDGSDGHLGEGHVRPALEVVVTENQARPRSAGNASVVWGFNRAAASIATVLAGQAATRSPAHLDCGPRVLETASSCGWGIAVMTTTLAFFLIAFLLMLGVIADSLWGGGASGADHWRASEGRKLGWARIVRAWSKRRWIRKAGL